LIGNNSVCSNFGESYRGIVLIGNNVRSEGVCIGENGSVSSKNGVCVGVNSNATSGVCIGSNSHSGFGIAIGSNVDANPGTGDIGVVVGRNCSGSGLAIGYMANCGDGISIGSNTSCSGSYTIAFGHNVFSTQNSIAIGPCVQSDTIQGIAIGYGAMSGSTFTGSDRGRGIAIGANSRSDRYGIAIGACAVASNPLNNILTGNYCTAVGYSASAFHEGSSAFGYSSYATGNWCTAIGYDAHANGNYCTAIGTGASARGNSIIQIGNNNDSNITTYVKNLQTANSDIRIKEEVEDANTSICLQNVRDLKIHRYKFKNFVRGQYDVHQIGWVADELMNFYPKSVHQKDVFFEDVDENGNVIYDTEIDENGNEIRKPKTIKIENLKSIDFHLTAVPILWGAVQELSKKIDALEQENLQLKERINSL
jgi:hypothetical protein